MTLETVRAFFGWAALLNLALLSLWFFLFLFGREWIYSLHSRWFPLPRQVFDSVIYGALAFYKICTLLFFLMPYLVLRLFL